MEANRESSEQREQREQVEAAAPRPRWPGSEDWIEGIWEARDDVREAMEDIRIALDHWPDQAVGSDQWAYSEEGRLMPWTPEHPRGGYREFRVRVIDSPRAAALRLMRGLWNLSMVFPKEIDELKSMADAVVAAEAAERSDDDRGESGESETPTPGDNPSPEPAADAATVIEATPELIAELDKIGVPDGVSIIVDRSKSQDQEAA